MARVLQILLVTALSGCVVARAPSSSAAIVGCYSKTDKTGYNTLHLRLNPDNSYVANLQGDIGSWGSASGNWGLDGDKITLTPVKENEQMTGFLRKLTVLRSMGQYQLLPTSGWDALSTTRCYESFGHANGR